MIERRGLEVAVGPADVAAADRLEQLAVERGDHDAVVVAVADEQPVALLVGQNLAGKAQRRGVFLDGFQLELERRFVEQLLVAVVGNRDFQDLADFLGFELAAVGPRRHCLRGRSAGSSANC